MKHIIGCSKETSMTHKYEDRGISFKGGKLKGDYSLLLRGVCRMVYHQVQLQRKVDKEGRQVFVLPMSQLGFRGHCWGGHLFYSAGLKYFLCLC